MANENKVVLKNTSKKTEEHFISHLQYLQKEDASVLYLPNAKDSVEVCNIQRKRLGDKKGKKGRPPIIAKDIIFSIPNDLKELTDKMSNKELKSLFDIFMDTVLQGIKKQHPNANIKFLKKNMLVAYHRDSDDRHFHCTIPAFTKTTNLFNDKIIAIDYSKRIISANARKKMFYKFESMRGIKNIEEMTTEQFIAKGIEERKKNGSKSNSWRKRKKAIVESTEELQILKDRRIEAIASLNKERGHLGALYDKTKKLLETAEKQIANGNSQRATKTLDKAISNISHAKTTATTTNKGTVQ